jgi:hypothetical protein
MVARNYDITEGYDKGETKDILRDKAKVEQCGSRDATLVTPVQYTAFTWLSGLIVDTYVLSS